MPDASSPRSSPGSAAGWPGRIPGRFPGSGPGVRIDDWFLTAAERGNPATRLPNGHTMICSFNEKRVVVVDRTGGVVWEQKVGSTPWRAHMR